MHDHHRQQMELRRNIESRPSYSELKPQSAEYQSEVQMIMDQKIQQALQEERAGETPGGAGGMGGVPPGAFFQHRHQENMTPRGPGMTPRTGNTGTYRDYLPPDEAYYGTPSGYPGHPGMSGMGYPGRFGGFGGPRFFEANPERGEEARHAYFSHHQRGMPQPQGAQLRQAYVQPSVSQPVAPPQQ